MIAGIVLAAGLSRRMGRPKLLLDLDGSPVIRRTVERLLSANLDDLVVVTGPADHALAEALRGLTVRLAVNPEPQAGQASSIVAGIKNLRAGTEAALVALGDQPTVPVLVISQLLAVFHASRKPIAAPVYREGRGNPVLFAASVFPELLALAGDQGARSVVDRDPARVALVTVDASMPPDVDTPEDYARLSGSPPPV